MKCKLTFRTPVKLLLLKMITAKPRKFDHAYFPYLFIPSCKCIYIYIFVDNSFEIPT